MSKISKNKINQEKRISFAKGFIVGIWGFAIILFICEFAYKTDELTELKKESLRLEIQILEAQLRN